MAAAGDDGFREHIRDNCQLYRENRDAMIEAAREFLPRNVGYNVPNEGMFVWFTLPEGCDARRMIDEQSEKLKVLLVPGDAFSTTGGLRNAMRASFSMVSPDEIREGMRRFGEMIRTEMGRLQ
jgi:2-aminoadipate transaminase